MSTFEPSNFVASNFVDRLRHNIETTHYRPGLDELLDAATNHMEELEMRIACALEILTREGVWLNRDHLAITALQGDPKSSDSWPTEDR